MTLRRRSRSGHRRGERLCGSKRRRVGRREGRRRSPGWAGSERQCVGWREGWRGARCVGWIETHRRRVAATQWFARVTVFIIDLDVLHFGELLEIQGQRTRDGVEGAVRLTFSCEINVHDAISIGNLAVASETIENES